MQRMLRPIHRIMLFESTDIALWESIRAQYADALQHHVATKKDDSLNDLDHWYQTTFPATLTTRSPMLISSEELCRLMSWKLKRGKFRPSLQKLAASNSDQDVKRVSQEAFQRIRSSPASSSSAATASSTTASSLVRRNNVPPSSGGTNSSNLKDAITKMTELKGVGPATASAILCAGCPTGVPFMADETMSSVPGLGTIAYTIPYYIKFASRVIDKANQLKQGGSTTVTTPHDVEMVLWTDYMLDKYNVPRKPFGTAPSSKSDNTEKDTKPAGGDKEDQDTTRARSKRKLEENSEVAKEVESGTSLKRSKRIASTTDSTRARGSLARAARDKK